jgi:hypothetical protein
VLTCAWCNLNENEKYIAAQTHVPNKYKSPERLRNDWASLDSSPPWAIDAWGLGCVIFEVFNGLVVNAEELLDVNKVRTFLLHRIHSSDTHENSGL